MNKYDLAKKYFKAAELSRLPQLSPSFLPAFQQFQAAMAQAADMEREMEALDTRSRHAMRTRSQEDPDWTPLMSDIDSFLEDAIADNVDATEAAMQEKTMEVEVAMEEARGLDREEMVRRPRRRRRAAVGGSMSCSPPGTREHQMSRKG
jgi:hypothetical protein